MTFEEIVHKNLEMLSKRDSCYSLDVPSNSPFTDIDVIEYMTEEDIAKYENGKHRITRKGRQIQIDGGWLKHLQQQQITKKQEKNSHINIIGDIKNSPIIQGSDFRDFTNAQSVVQEPKQKAPEKRTIWSDIPEWAKILGGLGAIAGLIKVIIELNKP